jgi:hypothetical protein
METSIFNDEKFLLYIKEKMNHKMEQAAEPIIKEALKKIEEEMRKELAANLISFMDSSFAVERYGQDIRIIIHGREDSK